MTHSPNEKKAVDRLRKEFPKLYSLIRGSHKLSNRKEE